MKNRGTQAQIQVFTDPEKGMPLHGLPMYLRLRPRLTIRGQNLAERAEQAYLRALQ